MKTDLNKLPVVRIIIVLCLLSFGYGFASHKLHIFPYDFLKKQVNAFKEIADKIKGKRHWYYQQTEQTMTVPVYSEAEANNGLTLITAVDSENWLSARIITMEGETVQKWTIAWDELWGDSTHIPEEDLPKSRPGTHIHGAVIMDNGDLVFNFEHLGLVRLNVCGEIVWRLPYRTHHSVYLDELNNLWVSGQRNSDTPLPGYPNYKPPVIEPTVLKVSPEGEILEEISILALLRDNNMQGMLFVTSKDNWDTSVSGDILHLNDVETFPGYMDEGIFKAGDIMISLRNINAVMVFGADDHKLRFMSIGGFVRQHDPDFIDGNTISVFDNNNIAPANHGHQSRIITISAPDGKQDLYFTGTATAPFYTDIMGKHQWLPNGNLLITETMKGKAFEVNRQGSTVWEYINIVDTGYVGVVEEAQRLSTGYTSDFYKKQQEECSAR